MKTKYVKYFITFVSFLFASFFIIFMREKMLPKEETAKKHVYVVGNVIKKEYVPGMYYPNYYVPPRFYITYIISINDKTNEITTEINNNIFNNYDLDDTVLFCLNCNTLKEFCPF